MFIYNGSLQPLPPIYVLGFHSELSIKRCWWLQRKETPSCSSCVGDSNQEQYVDSVTRTTFLFLAKIVNILGHFSIHIAHVNYLNVKLDSATKNTNFSFQKHRCLNPVRLQATHFFQKEHAVVLGLLLKFDTALCILTQFHRWMKNKAYPWLNSLLNLIKGLKIWFLQTQRKIYSPKVKWFTSLQVLNTRAGLEIVISRPPFLPKIPTEAYLKRMEIKIYKQKDRIFLASFTGILRHDFGSPTKCISYLTLETQTCVEEKLLLNGPKL